MKIQCENCSVEHELDPPAWVVSSGRPFRFRCSSCGHSQMVSAQAGAKGPAPEEATPQPRRAPPVEATVAASALPLDAQAVSAPPSESSGAPPVYLKQEGKVYLVRDWATVQRWIMERRVDREDLVSEGGVRWEPIGNRAELGSFFAAVEQLEANEQQAQAPEPAAAPFATPTPLNPFATPFPFGGGDDDANASGRFGRLDDDTEGVSMGLPPLPTEEEPGAASEGKGDYPEQPAVRRAARMSEPSAAPADEPEFGEPEPPHSPSADLARMRADTIPPDTAPPALPPTPAPLPRVELHPSRPSAPSALAMADTVIHEPDAADDEHFQDDPFAGFGKPVVAHDTAPVNDWEEPEPPPRSYPAWLPPVLGIAATSILAVGLLSIWAVTSMTNTGATPPTAHVIDSEPGLGKVIAPPEPEKAPQADTDAPVEIATVEVPVAASVTAVPAPVEPAPKVAVDPTKPAPEKAVSAPKLVEKGWAAVDRGDLAGAGSQFQKALGSSPDNADANFGYGYVLLKQGQTDLAQRHLCRALKLTGAESDVGREASGLVTASGLSCP